MAITVALCYVFMEETQRELRLLSPFKWLENVCQRNFLAWDWECFQLNSRTFVGTFVVSFKISFQEEKMFFFANRMKDKNIVTVLKNNKKSIKNAAILYCKSKWIFDCYIISFVCLNASLWLARGFKITEIMTEFASQWFFNGTLSVDTFFFISGMLTTFVTWRLTMGDSRLFSIPAFIIARVLRLTPPVMVVIAFTFFLPLFGSGPAFTEMIDPVVNACKANWWTNMLYLQNWIDTEHICLLHTWFLASDMQFHFLALLVIIPLFRSKKFGMLINLVLLIGSICLSAVICYVNDYPPSMIYTQPEIEERWQLNVDYYWKPYTHVGPFCIGLALGYFMATNKMHRLSYRARMIGWGLSLSTLFLVLFGSYGWTMGLETHAIINALHHSTHRTVWSIGLAWIIYACVTGQGGWINSFLSWKGFVPMSRLSFMVYLVHPWLIWIFVANLRTMIDTSHYTGVWFMLLFHNNYYWSQVSF